MAVLFHYLGPAGLRPLATAGVARIRLHPGLGRGEILSALEIGDDGRDELTVTYIVDASGAVFLSDRHAEHIACARGEPVQAAGEMTLDLSDGPVEILSVSNQSTGYCPPPACWGALAEALSALGMPAPSGFDPAFEFARCRACLAIVIIKESMDRCVECGGELGPATTT